MTEFNADLFVLVTYICYLVLVTYTCYLVLVTYTWYMYSSLLKYRVKVLYLYL